MFSYNLYVLVNTQCYSSNTQNHALWMRCHVVWTIVSAMWSYFSSNYMTCCCVIVFCELSGIRACSQNRVLWTSGMWWERSQVLCEHLSPACPAWLCSVNSQVFARVHRTTSCEHLVCCVNARKCCVNVTLSIWHAWLCPVNSQLFIFSSQNHVLWTHCVSCERLQVSCERFSVTLFCIILSCERPGDCSCSQNHVLWIHGVSCEHSPMSCERSPVSCEVSFVHFTWSVVA